MTASRDERAGFGGVKTPTYEWAQHYCVLTITDHVRTPVVERANVCEETLRQDGFVTVRLVDEYSFVHILACRLNESTLAALRHYFRVSQHERHRDERTAPALADDIERDSGEKLGELMIRAKLWPIKVQGLFNHPSRGPRLPVGTALWNDEQRAALAEPSTLA